MHFISCMLIGMLFPQGVFGLMTIPAGLVILVGFLLDEPHMPNFAYKQV